MEWILNWVCLSFYYTIRDVLITYQLKRKMSTQSLSGYVYIYHSYWQLKQPDQFKTWRTFSNVMILALLFTLSCVSFICIGYQNKYKNDTTIIPSSIDCLVWAHAHIKITFVGLFFLDYPCYYCFLLLW